MVTIQELRERFILRDCPPYGPCLVVPGEEFNPDWEAELDIDVIKTDFGDPSKPYTLIPVKDEKPIDTPGLSTSPKNGVEVLAMNDPESAWKDEEFEFLIKLWSKQPRLTLKKMTKEFGKKFKGRSKDAIKDAFDRLKKKGKIQPRWKIKRKKGITQEEERKELKPPKSPKEPVTRTDLAAALAALVEAVGPENIQFNISIQIGSKAQTA